MNATIKLFHSRQAHVALGFITNFWSEISFLEEYRDELGPNDIKRRLVVAEGYFEMIDKEMAFVKGPLEEGLNAAIAEAKAYYETIRAQVK